ncbi:DUF4347 domain-containing protein, partial [Stenotrophomonas sp. YIM B06876]|uniref:DUF4347 domain-containing protein n=1 Tax=Stenotrophomonas sp. YIM B06876 TaxID=3060211 RepID=UPI002738B18B
MTTDLTKTAREIVFVDSRVKDVATLLKGLPPGAEVVYLNAGEDGLQQMAKALGEHGDVGAVHILAHGSAGQLWLGSTFLDAGTLAGQSEALAAIGRGLTEEGDLLVYACDMAAGEVGAQFVASLAALTGADVAASNNRTGAGGDWELEISTGAIESANVLFTQDLHDYQWGLATLTVTSNADSGVGTLRQALSDAVVGDTVTFSTSMTVQLSSELLVNKNIVLDGDLNDDGVADVTLNGQYKTRVVEVMSGSTVTLDGLVITQGLVAGNGAAAGTDGTAAMGGGIFNAGNLTLKNVIVTSNAASGGGGGGGVTAPYVGGAVGGGGGGGG